MRWFAWLLLVLRLSWVVPALQVLLIVVQEWFAVVRVPAVQALPAVVQG